MNDHVVEARYVAGHAVWLRFRDGTSGEIDLKPAFEGPVFEPLLDPRMFRQLEIAWSFTRWSGPMVQTLRPSSCTTTYE